MKSNTKWLLICIGIVLVGVVLYAYQEQIGVGEVTENTVLIQRGTLVHDPESLPDKEWVLQYQGTNAEPQYIDLAFDEESLCANAAVVEVCDMTKYQNNQAAQVEGYLQNGQFYVVRMIIINGN